ncbi:hypothetical protein PHMEG_00033670 [Phytophthora megakarya]|uniref:Uncharacterized protein n=1 Tax=Phytophthora megakarya TaxID=4795 RepID=A0A225UST4_9STRA|nr:hypothetical protein PHMEG_00033670 [Phytophthora megakarya]
MAACLIQRLCRRALGRKNINVNGSQDDEEKKQSPVPVRRAFSIADVALGASVRSVGSTRTQLKQGHSEPVQPSHLNSAATVPHLNLRRVREPETPRRSLTESSISLSNPDRTANSTKRSDIYDDEEEWKAPPPHSAHPTPRTNRSSKDNGTTSSVRSVTSTPRTNRTEDQPKTPQNDLVAGTPRNTTEEHTRRQNAAATRIQASSRGFAVRQRTRRQNAAATRIQASIRGFVVRQCTRRQNAAATRVQASIKGFVVRQRFAVENAVDLCRAYIERKHFDVTLDHAMTLELDFLEELSAIKIQALVRGCQSRLLTECTKAGVYHAVNTIQRSFRLHRLNTQRSIDEGVRSIAARTIQQVFRDYEVRRAAVHQAAVDEEILRVQQIAASTIQNIWKQYHLAQDLNFEEIEAATCIQALGRGHLTRKSLKSLRGSSSGALSKHSSAFSMSSSTEKLVKEEKSDVEVSLHINYSFLPSRIRELYISSSGKQLQSRNTHIQSQEISELGLTFADFLRELETCTEVVVGSSALDAMRIVVETSPDATKTLANVVKLAQVLDRRLQEGFWNEIIETSSMALLHAFKDVLDSQ